MSCALMSCMLTPLGLRAGWDERRERERMRSGRALLVGAAIGRARCVDARARARP